MGGVAEVSTVRVGGNQLSSGLGVEEVTSYVGVSNFVSCCLYRKRDSVCHHVLSAKYEVSSMVLMRH